MNPGKVQGESHVHPIIYLEKGSGFLSRLFQSLGQFVDVSSRQPRPPEVKNHPFGWS